MQRILFILVSVIIALVSSTSQAQPSESMQELIRKLNEIKEGVGIFHDKRFCPTYRHSIESNHCKQHIFGASDDFMLEPYWSQWRVGAHLKDELFTNEERKTPIKVAINDGGFEPYIEAFQELVVHRGGRPMSVNMYSEPLTHGSNSASITCSTDECSVGESENTQLYLYDTPVRGSTNPAIRHAINQGVRVHNQSMEFFKNVYSRQTQKTLKQIKNSNMISIWGAGNDYARIEQAFPDDVENIWAISSVDPLGERSFFSNRGKTIDFTAPADLIQTAMHGKRFGGTSGAAPVISGIVTNVLKVNPNLTPQQVKDILKITSFDLGPKGFDEDTGWGMPNMPKAILTARYIKEGKLTYDANDLDGMKKKLGPLLSQEVSPVSHKQLLANTSNCAEYYHGIKKLFKNYFLTEDATEVCAFYKHHKVYTSAVHFCTNTEDFSKPLLAALESKDPKIQKGAMHGLIQFPTAEAIQRLIELLEDKDEKVSEVASTVLSKMGQPVIDPIYKALQDESFTGHQNAFFVLGNLVDQMSEKQKDDLGAITQQMISYDSSIENKDLLVESQNTHSTPEAANLEPRKKISIFSRQSAMILFAKIKPQKALQVLKPYLSSPSTNFKSGARVGLTNAYKKTKDPNILNAIIEHVQHTAKCKDMDCALDSMYIHERFKVIGDDATAPLLKLYKNTGWRSSKEKNIIEGCLKTVRQYSKDPDIIRKITKAVGE